MLLTIVLLLLLSLIVFLLYNKFRYGKFIIKNIELPETPIEKEDYEELSELENSSGELIETDKPSSIVLDDPEDPEGADILIYDDTELIIEDTSKQIGTIDNLDDHCILAIIS